MKARLLFLGLLILSLLAVDVYKRQGGHGMSVESVAYEQMSDEEIIALATAGNLSALEYILNKYTNFVKSRARPYFLMGADREDIIQEGMIGLYKAIRDFRSEKLSSFRAFAEICITRQIITAIKTATRQKHVPQMCIRDRKKA